MEMPKFLSALIEANAMAGQSYLTEYNQIVSQAKREMIEGDIDREDE